MPRVARIVVPGLPHHVTQRGNNRQDVFFVDDDRRAYLKILGEQCRGHGVALLGYCLMSNHVHLIPVPARADSLARAIGRTHWMYTRYINRMHRRSGHLWQNRFYSNAMDDEHCLLAMRYVEWNPIRAGLCRIARWYPWSSAAVHCGTNDETSLLDTAHWTTLTRGVDWENALSEAPTERQVAIVRRASHTGRPLAGDSFLGKLERKLGRRLRPLPTGRPAKSLETNSIRRKRKSQKRTAAK